MTSINNFLGRLRGGASIAGIWRDEMAPEITPYVHPSCFAVRRDTLRELGINFAREGRPKSARTSPPRCSRPAAG